MAAPTADGHLAGQQSAAADLLRQSLLHGHGNASATLVAVSGLLDFLSIATGARTAADKCARPLPDCNAVALSYGSEQVLGKCAKVTARHAQITDLAPSFEFNVGLSENNSDASLATCPPPAL
ncbi:hypothetical protein D0859_02150 [Hortaea werneckii]|uniref:Uncharacterized protein n=1 Tax=Hortaea werneckii TaxID=91943 RepID=A0A3M7J7F6_HORWE|nr:hypothetical protein D0859_02150 [Hortaea werneckii]